MNRRRRRPESRVSKERTRLGRGQRLRDQTASGGGPDKQWRIGEEESASGGEQARVSDAEEDGGRSEDQALIHGTDSGPVYPPRALASLGLPNLNDLPVTSRTAARSRSHRRRRSAGWSYRAQH